MDGLNQPTRFVEAIFFQWAFPASHPAISVFPTYFQCSIVNFQFWISIRLSRSGRLQPATQPAVSVFPTYFSGNSNYVNASIPKDYVKKLFSWNYFNTSKHYFREVILINKFLAMCDSFSLNKMTIFINIAPIKFLTNHWSHGAHFVIFENFAPHQTLFSSSSIDFSS